MSHKVESFLRFILLKNNIVVANTISKIAPMMIDGNSGMVGIGEGEGVSVEVPVGEVTGKGVGVEEGRGIAVDAGVGTGVDVGLGPLTGVGVGVTL